LAERHGRLVGVEEEDWICARKQTSPQDRKEKAAGGRLKPACWSVGLLQRGAKTREVTCHTSAPQSHYSNPTLVPSFMIECQNDVRFSKDNATFGSPTYSGDSGSNVLDGRERTIDKASGHLIVQNMKA